MPTITWQNWHKIIILNTRLHCINLVLKLKLHRGQRIPFNNNGHVSKLRPKIIWQLNIPTRTVMNKLINLQRLAFPDLLWKFQKVFRVFKGKSLFQGVSRVFKGFQSGRPPFTLYFITFPTSIGPYVNINKEKSTDHWISVDSTLGLPHQSLMSYNNWCSFVLLVERSSYYQANWGHSPSGCCWRHWTPRTAPWSASTPQSYWEGTLPKVSYNTFCLLIIQPIYCGYDSAQNVPLHTLYK